MPVMGWIAVGLALLVSFGIDLGNVAQGGWVDMRNRITGVRLLEHGIDPYHFVARKFPWAVWPCALALQLSWAVDAFSNLPMGVLYLPALFFTLGAVLSLFSFTTRTASADKEAFL